MDVLTSETSLSDLSINSTLGLSTYPLGTARHYSSVLWAELGPWQIIMIIMLMLVAYDQGKFCFMF